MAEGSDIIEDKEVAQEGRPRVLIVEDDKASLKLLGSAVKIHGSFADPDRTDSVSGANDFLRKAKEDGRTYAVVICDLGLGGNVRGGLEVAKKAKEEGFAGTFILYTGRAKEISLEYNPEQLRGMGIDKLIGKPASAEDIEKALNEARDKIMKSEPIS